METEQCVHELPAKWRDIYGKGAGNMHFANRCADELEIALYQSGEATSGLVEPVIAAAPELLDALRRTQMALADYLPAHRNAVTDAAIAVADAAIAKALGMSSNT